MLRPALLALVGLLAACHKPDPAPTELNDLCGYLYTHAQDEDPELISVGIDNLALWLEAHPDDTVGDGGYQVDNLDQETLDSLDDRDRSNANLVGGTVTTDSPYPIEGDLAEALVTADQTQVYPDVYDSFTRTFDGDGDCFVAQDCDTVQFDNESVANLPLNIKVTTVTTGQFRWVQTTDHGKAMITRAWLHDPADVSVDFFKVDAQYFLTVTYDLDDGAKRLQATWADAQIIGIDVPEGTALNMLINSFKKNDEMLYAFVAAENGDTDEPR
jgi:hypothetical protein